MATYNHPLSIIYNLFINFHLKSSNLLFFINIINTYIMKPSANPIIEGLQSNCKLSLHPTNSISFSSRFKGSKPSINWLNLNWVESVVSRTSFRVSSKNWWADISVDGRDSNQVFCWDVPSNWKINLYGKVVNLLKETFQSL